MYAFHARPQTVAQCGSVGIDTGVLPGKAARRRRKAMPTEQEMKAELEKLRAENDALKKRSSRAISLKVSEKGAVSVYGLGRFPVTLYKEQWSKLMDMAEEIRAFIRDNDSKLKTKE
jgi:hypothetical protein